MADMNAGIILAGRSPDIMGAYGNGLAVGQAQNVAQQRNALTALYQQQGPQIMAGEPNALAALARIDAPAAFGMQYDQQRLDVAKAEAIRLADQAAREAEAWAMDKSAAELEAARAEANDALMGVVAPLAPDIMRGLQGDAEAWQRVTQAAEGYGMTPDQLVGQAFAIDRVADVLKGVGSALPKPAEPPAPMSPAGKVQADVAAGFITPEQGAAAMAPRGPLVQIGPGGAPTVGDTYNPADAQAAIDAIDSIAADPNLGRVTGSIMGGGGNNIDDLSVPQRMYYGDAGTALVEKIGQLQNVTWLSARQMLKGGGAITDYESRKAEGAVARLSRAKGEPEFRAALKDLRDAISEGMAKLQGGAPATAPAAPGAGSGSPAAPAGTAVPALDDQTLQLLDEETRQWYLDFVGSSSR
jgi:hypothetical protein